MSIRIDLEEIPELDIRNVSVIGSFNGYDAAKGVLEKEGDVWFTYIALEPGEHYYKFLINNEILLNDPNANIYLPHAEDGLWSVIKINEEGERLYNNEPYAVHIEDYAVSGTITEEKININKKSFHLRMDKQLVVRLGFREIVGLHAVTVVWYDSRGAFYQMSEQKLYAAEQKEMVFLWYWLDLTEFEKEYSEGLWTMKLFIDGSYVLEDKFSVTSSITYSRDSLLSQIR